MQSKELEEVRRLFESTESENNPERKFSFLEEALDLADEFRSEHISDSSELTIVDNLRHSHLHRLLVQLTATRGITIDAWFLYINLFFFRLEPEIQAILLADEGLRDSYRKFVSIWREEIVAILERNR